MTDAYREWVRSGQGRDWTEAERIRCVNECAEFGDPPCWKLDSSYSPCDLCRDPAPVDRSGEAIETGTGSTEGESAVPKAGAHTSSPGDPA